MKKTSIISIVLFSLVLVFGSAQATVEGTAYIDKESIKERKHINVLKNFKEQNDREGIHVYLSNLSENELIEAMAEVAEDSSNYNELLIFSSHFKRSWENTAPYDKVAKLIKDKDFHPNFRNFLIDIITKVNHKKGYEHPQITQTLLEISSDKNEDEIVRKNALLSIRKNGFENLKTDSSVFQNIFNDKNNPEEVKGAAITAMYRTSDLKFEEVIDNVLSNHKNYSNIVKRHALFNAALSGLSKKYIKDLSEVARTTDDSEVYSTAIYSLGITGGPEAIESILLNYGKYNNPHIGNAALEMNFLTVQKMLESNQGENINKQGIKAASILNLKNFKEPLEKLIVDTNSLDVKREAQNILNQITQSDLELNFKRRVR